MQFMINTLKTSFEANCVALWPAWYLETFNVKGDKEQNNSVAHV